MIYHHESAPSSLCSDIVMVNTHRRSYKYKFHSIWHLALSSTTTTKSFITPNRTPESIIRRLNNNTTMVHNTLNRKLNIEQHWNPGVNWDAPEGLAVPDLVVEPVVWLILSVYILMSFDFPFVKLFGVR